MAGHTALCDAGEGTIVPLPTLKGQKGWDPIAISVTPPRPDAVEDELYVMHPIPDRDISSNAFEVLRFGSRDWTAYRPNGEKSWYWDSLPPPPFHGIVYSHTVVDWGHTICVSSSSRPNGFGFGSYGTYCFDTLERAWWKAGDWVLPFVGGAEYVPGLNLWVGFSSSRPHDLCVTSDLHDMEKPPTLQHVLPDLTPKHWSPIRMNLLNLGSGRFCTVRFIDCVSETDPFGDAPMAVVLTGVELVTGRRLGAAMLMATTMENKVSRARQSVTSRHVASSGKIVCVWCCNSFQV
ncbi:hypothetical protein ACP70R_019975 [Stipagrostis hirtigluma subsp. patula]